MPHDDDNFELRRRLGLGTLSPSVAVMNSKAKVLAFLQAHPSGWHYGLDIARGAKVSRATIYLHLGSLEDESKVERRLESPVYQHVNRLPRPLFRITREGLREPIGDHGEAIA
jgi:DNA-binding transcriptional ArsR family regulator